MKRAMIDVLIADDTLIARQGLREILRTEDDLEIVGEVQNALETIPMARDLKPDVLLIDLNWFGDRMAGIDAIRQIRRLSPETRIIAMTAYRTLIPDARRAGAVAALPKGFSKAELVSLIRAASEADPGADRLPGVDSDRFSIARLAAGIGIPVLGFLLLVAPLMWGIRSLSIEKFAVVVVPSLLFYFFLVIFAGRYVNVISETSTYKLFVKILDILGLRLSGLPWDRGQ